MSYIPQSYELKIEVRPDVSWDSRDTDYVANRLEALKYELDKSIGDKFTITLDSN